MRAFLFASATDLEGSRSAVLLTLLLPVHSPRGPTSFADSNFARLQKCGFDKVPAPPLKFPVPPKKFPVRGLKFPVPLSKGICGKTFVEPALFDFARRHLRAENAEIPC